MSSADGGNGVSIGNYKGVMLCNRPFAGVSAAAKKATGGKSGNTVPFLSTCQNRERLGLNPIRHPPNVVVDRSKKHTALSKHRKYLHELQKKKQEMEKEIIRSVEKKEEKRIKLREKLRIKRERIVKERRGEDYECSGRIHGNNYEEEEEQESKYWEESKQNNQEEKEAEEEQKLQETKEQELNQDDRRSRKKSLERKPKWALSKNAVEELEDLEAMELVDFAKKLDFEEFLGDLEVRAALQTAKERIDILKDSRSNDDGERKSNDDENDDDSRAQCNNGDEETKSTGSNMTAIFEYLANSTDKQDTKNAIQEKLRARRARKAAAKASKELDWNSNTNVTAQQDSDEVRSVASARSILSNSSVKSLKQIHSARSLAKVATQVAREDEAGTSASRNLVSVSEVDEDASAPSFCPPRIVRIHEDDRSRLTKKGETYNLPYMNRNPAI